MKLQTKLAIIFSLLAIIPIALIGYLSYLSERNTILKSSLERLIAVADIQERRINDSVDRYLEQASLITSRTQMRVSFDAYSKTGNIAEYERTKRILIDAQDSIRGIERVTLINPDGTALVSTVDAIEEINYSKELFFNNTELMSRLTGFFKNKDGLIRARIMSPLILNQEHIGVAEVVINPIALISVTTDYTGLGETGEALLAEQNERGDAQFLTPVRFDADAALTRVVSKEQDNSPIIPAIYGEERVFFGDNSVDYRGHGIVAATRFIDSVGWGLVLKLDRDEIFEPIQELTYVISTIITLSILFIVFIVFFTLRTVLEPIRLLTLFAHNLQKGNFSMRVEVDSRGEINILANTMNDMAEKLQGLYRGLEEKVKQRTIELENATEKLTLAKESAKIGVWEWDIKNNALKWDDRMYELYGMDKANFSGAYEAWQDGLHPDDKERIEKEIHYAIDKHRLLDTEFRVVWPNGTVRYIKASGQIRYDEKEQPSIMIGMSWDITKEKEIDKTKSEFVSLASHQLRTPLSAVNWYTEMLLAEDMGEINDEQKKYLEEIYTGNQRMVELVNALLNVSRLELGTFVVEPEPTDITEVIRSVMKEQKIQSDAKKQKVETDFARDIPIIQADKKLLRMVFQNLISNAIKYTGEEGDIRIKTSIQGENIIVNVSDTGWGIPKDQQSKIFSKLFRANNVKERDTEGTGLGLYIVKSVIEHSGGSISFKSEEGEGTTFRVSLPLGGMKKKEGEKRLD